ncbi:MAG: hypothetical protein QME65_06250, partial [Candidatus Omnitrophota bacterium]|nr:hypothetical protein [Candidatus Omnitrophota bacterium]
KAKKKVLRRKAVRRTPKKKAKAPKKAKLIRPVKARKTKEKVVGTVTHYFPHVNAAVIKLKAPLSVGEKIKIKGHTTDFIQEITSMQIDRVPINSAKKGQEIGLLVDSRVRQHDLAYKA